MSNNTKITIITACYNAEDTIEQTILSVLNQTYKNVEYIVVDGASTDGTMNIVNKYKDKIDVVISEPDMGIYNAFNKGVKMATGEYINFMNADDYFLNNNSLDDVVNLIEQTPNRLKYYGHVRAIDDFNGNWYVRGKELSLSDFENGHMYPHQSAFTHKSLFKELGGFDESYPICADIDFAIRSFKLYEDKMQYINIEVAYFRIGGVSSSINSKIKFDVENLKVRLNHFGKAPAHLTSKVNSGNNNTSEIKDLWLQLLIKGINPIESTLRKNNSKQIMIFGTKVNATNIYNSLGEYKDRFIGFLDNDEHMVGNMMHNEKIIKPTNETIPFDTLIINSVENPITSRLIENKLASIINEGVKIIHWKDCVLGNNNF